MEYWELFVGAFLVMTLLLIFISEQGGTKFSPEVLETMKKVNDYDRYMEGSRMYDSDPFTDREKKKHAEIDVLRKSLSQEAKDFMNYNHWRTWNS